MQTDYASAPSQKFLAWAAEVVDDVNFFLSSSTVYELKLNESWKIPVHLGTHAKSAVAVVKTQLHSMLQYTWRHIEKSVQKFREPN